MTKEKLAKLIRHEGNEKRFSYKEVECLILRQYLGHLCGYAKVPLEHIWHNVNYLDIDWMHYIDIPVHGRLTFSGAIPREAGWWVGFDCGHFGDLIPYQPDLGGIYRDMNYVQSELEKLVDFMLGVKEDKTND